METTRTSDPTYRLLDEWRVRAMLALFAYNRAANRCRRWETFLGGAATILTASIGTAVFATLKSDVDFAARLIVGTASVAAAVLSAIQVFAALPGRIEQYEKAARRFGAIRREIEETQALAALGQDLSAQVLDNLRSTLDDAADNSPNAPSRIWARTRRHVKGEYTWWERGYRKLSGLHPPQGLTTGPDDSISASTFAGG